MSFGFNGLKIEARITHKDSSARASGEAPGTQAQGSGLMKFRVAELSHVESAYYAYTGSEMRFRNLGMNRASYLESNISTQFGRPFILTRRFEAE
jgi:hypothetical protein